MPLTTVLIVMSVGATALAGGVFMFSHGREEGEAAPVPSAPPKRQAPAKVAPSAAGHQVVELVAGTPLEAQLAQHASAAELRGLRPFLEVGASWCPPSRMFGEFLVEARMQAALAGIYLIRVDSDSFSSDPLLRELKIVAVPVFFELDAGGSSTGRKVDGGAWGPDTLENMSDTMAAFFSG